MTASKTARWSVRFGPFAFGGSRSASTRSISAQCSSETRQIGGNGSRTFFGRPMQHLHRDRGCTVHAYVR
jgi:hypothetical protein